MELAEIITDISDALKAVDQEKPSEMKQKGGYYLPGIGPHNEDHLRDFAIKHLKEDPEKKHYYLNAGPKYYIGNSQECDLVIPGEWAIELKLLRPYGDNGNEADHWSNKILHPYYGNKSSMGDVLKLIRSGFSERKAIILFGFEHADPKIDIEMVLRSFEIILLEVHGISLSSRINIKRGGLVHPVFQTLRVIGWEIIGKK